MYIQTDYTIKTGWLTTAAGNKYYFDADGKLAVSTTIDGYEVDADGTWKE